MLALWTIVACGPELPDPELVGVTPGWAYNGEETPIRLVGRNLYPSVHVDPGDEDGQVDAQFTVALVDGDTRHELTGVTLEDYSELTARVPAGFPVGTYDLTLSAPSGGEATLADAFEVTDTRADHLAFSLEEASHPVFELVSIGLRLEDPEGDTVPERLEVAVIAQSADGKATDLSFEPGSLDGQVTIEGGISGNLGADGTGYVVLSSETPDDIWLSVEPVDTESPVTAASVLLSFEPSAASEVRIDLPTTEFATVAGEPFDVVLTVVDAYGNEVADQQASVLLTEACGSFREQLSLVGSTTVEVAVTGATGSSCTANSLTAFGSGMSGVSADFEVSPAEVASLDVQPSTEAVVAGEAELQVLLSARDTFDNVLADYREELSFSDDLGGLDSAAGVGGATCGEWWEGGLLFCTLTFERAGVATLTARDADGIEGSAPGIQVLPADAATLTLETADTPRAGTSWALTATVEDVYGNGAVIEPLGEHAITTSDDLGGTTCVWSHEPETGVHELSCESTAAGARTVTVAIDSLGLSETLAVEVQNGPLALVEATPAPATAEAGVAVTMSLVATDAYGNAYLVQDEGDQVDLAVDEGTLSPTTVTLDSDGVAVPDLTLTAAGDRTVGFSAGGQALGGVTVVVSRGHRAGAGTARSPPPARRRR